MKQTTLKRLSYLASRGHRGVATLPSNSHIKVFENNTIAGKYILSLLSTEPPRFDLAVGTSDVIPPTPQSFQENPRFRKILDEVIVKYGSEDEFLKMQARAFVGSGGTNLAAAMQKTRYRGGTSGRPNPAAEASHSHRVGGYIHLSDTRNPPEFGRIAWPEDILGSVEVNGEGEIIGRVQPSGTYRILTNQGILGLSPFLMEKLVDQLSSQESSGSNGEAEAGPRV
ncbi:hypothetical protein HOO65_010975 [Ceratocystis lukuohia]|uniref:Uncharacterized protein n=1 Tax=Ceratocystis lukuohia TaxID=2019550 RepID=A0ABR4MTL3_9PEZI